MIAPPQSPSFWRRDDVELDGDSGRVIRGGMLPHQRAWWDLPNFFKVLVGGFGAGKTIALSKWGVASALQNAPYPVALVSPSYAMARRTLIPTINELLVGKRSLLGSSFNFKWNGSDKAFVIRYHGRVGRLEIYSGDNPDSLRGPNLAALGIDEPFIQDEKVFQHAVARVRHPNAVKQEVRLTGTPEQLNWGYELCVGKLKKENDVGVVRASSRENPITVASGYVKRLETMYDERTAQAYLDARFVSLAKGRVYYAFDAMEHVFDLPMPSGAQWGFGMDFNVNPMASTVFWRAGSHIHFEKEYELQNADTEYACSVLKDEWWDRGLRDCYPDATGSGRRTAAPGGKSDFTYIRRAGFRIHTKVGPDGRPSNPERKDRYNAVNGKFKPRDGKLSISVSPKCERLVRYLDSYSHEQMNKQESFSHLLDAFSYPVAYLFPIVREEFSTTQVSGA